MWEAELLQYLCSEWNYPGVSAVLAEDASVLLPIIEVYTMGQQRPPDTGGAVGQSAVSGMQSLGGKPLLTDADLDAMGAPQLTGAPVPNAPSSGEG